MERSITYPYCVQSLFTVVPPRIRRVNLRLAMTEELGGTAFVLAPCVSTARRRSGTRVYDDEERGSSRHSWSRSVVVTAHPMRSANEVGRHGGRLICPINVREVKNLEMNHDSPPVHVRRWSSRDLAGRAHPCSHARHASARS